MKTKTKNLPQLFSMNNMFNQYSNGIIKYNGRNFTEYDNLPNVQLQKTFAWDGAIESATGGLPIKGKIGKSDVLNTGATNKVTMQYSLSGITPLVANSTYSGNVRQYSNFATGGSSSEYRSPRVTAVCYSGSILKQRWGLYDSHTSFRIDDIEYNYGRYGSGSLGYVMVVKDSYTRRIKKYRDKEDVCVFGLNLDSDQVELLQAAVDREIDRLLLDEETKKEKVGADPRYTYYHYHGPTENPSAVNNFYVYDIEYYNCTHWFRYILDQALTDGQKRVFRKQWRALPYVLKPQVEIRETALYTPHAVNTALKIDFTENKGGNFVTLIDPG